MYGEYWIPQEYPVEGQHNSNPDAQVDWDAIIGVIPDDAIVADEEEEEEPELPGEFTIRTSIEFAPPAKLHFPVGTHWQISL